MKINQSGDISFYEDTGTTAKFFWDASAESLGIGGAPDVWDTFNAVQANNISLAGYSTTQGGVIQNAYYAGGWKYSSTNPASMYYQDSGAHQFHTAASGTADTALTWSQKMIIDSSGSVGIGTSSPSAKLQVEDASNATIDAVTTGGATTRVSSASTAGYLGTTTNHPAIFVTNTTERMRIDSSGNVGIGTSSPNSYSGYTTVTVNGSANGSVIDFERSGTVEGQLVATANAFGVGAVAASGVLTFRSGGNTERMRIDSSGQVGIGTSSPQQDVHVQSSGSATVIAERTGVNAGILGIYASQNPAIVWGTSSDALRFAQIDDTALGGFTERMRIDSNGSVGIGTSSPVGRLSLQGAAGTNGKEQGILLKYSNGTEYGALGLNNSSGWPQLMARAGAGITFHTNSDLLTTNEAMRIDSNGNLLIGTTDTTLYNNSGSGEGMSYFPSQFLTVATSGQETAIFNRLSSDGTILQFRKDGTTVGSIGSETTGNSDLFIGNGDTGIVFHDGNDAIMPYNTSTGSFRDNAIDLGFFNERWDDVYATNGTIQTSDQNEKQDIAELSDAEQRVAVAAKGLLRKFRWRDAVEEKGDEARTHFGIIAQDLQAAFAAEGLDAGDYAMFIHSTWTDEETGEERSRMGVRYSELLAFIIAAI
jgi:hypothetical protein